MHWRDPYDRRPPADRPPSADVLMAILIFATAGAIVVILIGAFLRHIGAL